MVRLTGKSYVVFITGFVGLLAMAVYPALISPMINPDPYKKNREAILPQLKTK